MFCDVNLSVLPSQYSDEVDCNGNGTVNFDGSCTCGATWTGTHCDECIPTYYPKPSAGDFGAGPESSFCINLCIDDTNSSDSAPNYGPNTCSAHGTCGGAGVCTCDTHYTNDDVPFATNGDCDARQAWACQGSAISLDLCPIGTDIDVIHARWSGGTYPGPAAECPTAAATCTGTDADNVLTSMSAFCEFSITVGSDTCSFIASRATLGDPAVCYTAGDVVFANVIYKCPLSV